MKSRKTHGFYNEGVENTQTKNTPTVERTEKKEEKLQTVPQAEVKKQEKKKENEQLTIKKKEYDENDKRNEMIQYAYDIGGMELVTMMECENSTWNMYRQSEVVKNGRREPSYGLCMIDRDFHPEIIDNKRFREDRKWQIEECNRLRKGGTKFYGPSRKIKGQRCSEYVKDRFSLT